ncbi:MULTISPECIES: S1C family serine protease [Citricoccus]|uniref:S1C family serine protease n=1 Tax=Citricoccus TaxID=169133 RepID=UPI000255F021|nr:S1C family serine protease [Citricoccus sp. CH26A]
MNDPSDPRDPGRDAAGVPPYPGRPPAVGPVFPVPGQYPARGAHRPHGHHAGAHQHVPYGQYPHHQFPSGRPPRRPRRGAYRLIIATGVTGALILAGGVTVLTVQEIRDIVAVQEGETARPAAEGESLGETLRHAHDGIRVDWAAGPNLDEAGLDVGRKVTEAPGVLMVDTRLMSGIGTGTGIVLSGEGLAITNYHVVEDASEVTVTVADTGETYDAAVLGRDSLHDVAVLQIEDAPDLPTASIDPEVPRLGDRSAAVGNGGGQRFLTAVTGEVTALGESIVASSGVPDDYSRLTGLIETSADVVPGYSGGPLVDGAGQVVGITTAASQGEDAEAVDGYAIPVATALEIVAQVLSGEETDTVSIGVDGALGITVQTEGGAAVVREVSPGSSAERLGLRVGDTVHAVDGHSVVSAAELSEIVNDHNVGDIVSVQWTTVDGQERAGEIDLQAAVVY